jgi:hypothetical protein
MAQNGQKLSGESRSSAAQSLSIAETRWYHHPINALILHIFRLHRLAQ